MFVVYYFPFLFQSLGWHLHGVKACAMWDVANCDTISVVLLGNDVNWYSKSWRWNDNDSNYIASMNMALSHLFLWYHVGATRLQCNVFPNLKSWVDVRVWWYKNTRSRDGSVPIAESLQQWKKTTFCYNWKPTSSSAKTSSLEKSVHHVLGTMGHSNLQCTYFVATHTTFDVIKA